MQASSSGHSGTARGGGLSRAGAEAKHCCEMCEMVTNGGCNRACLSRKLTVPATMLPSVTGIRLETKNFCRVTLAPAVRERVQGGRG